MCSCCVRGYVNGEFEDIKKFVQKFNFLLEFFGSSIVFVCLKISGDFGYSVYRVSRLRSRKNFSIYRLTFSKQLDKFDKEILRKPLSDWNNEMENLRERFGKLESFCEGCSVTWEICFRG